MARPIKNNADYFSHDADMRNDPKVRALRRQFKVEGYGIWCMLLETITDSENFRLHINLDIIAGDYDIDPQKLSEIINYCVQLGLLQIDVDNSILWSKTLDNRFAVLLSKRKRDRDVVIDADNTHSKVKERKVKEKRVLTGGDPPAPTLDERSKEFYNNLTAYKKNYPKEMLRKFYDYWTEHSPKGKKLRFEKQSVFDIAKRLSTWAARDKIEPLMPADADPFENAAYNKTMWTTEAWEQAYLEQLKNNAFRKRFGYGELQESSSVALHS